MNSWPWLTFYMYAASSNSGSHASVASTLTKPSLQPLSVSSLSHRFIWGWGICKGQRTTCRGGFSPSTVWVLGIELGWSDSAVSTFTLSAIFSGPWSIWWWLSFCACLLSSLNTFYLFIFAQPSLKLSDPPASASKRLGLLACITTCACLLLVVVASWFWLVARVVVI